MNWFCRPPHALEEVKYNKTKYSHFRHFIFRDLHVPVAIHKDDDHLIYCMHLSNGKVTYLGVFQGKPIGAEEVKFQ